MRILFVTPYYYPATGFGGPVESMRWLVAGLREAGAHVTVVTTDASWDGRLSADEYAAALAADGLVRRHPVRMRWGPFRRYFFSPSLAWDVARSVGGCDIVLIQGLWAFTVGATARLCTLQGKPYVISPRGSLDPAALEEKGLKKAVYMRLVERWSLQRAAGIHFTTRRERDLAPRWVRSLPHFVVPNGFPVAGPQHEQFGWIRQRFGWSNSCFVWAMVGRIHPSKGFDLLLDAARRVQSQDWRIAVIGPDEGGYRREVDRLAEKYGIRDRLGYTGLLSRRQLDEAFAGCDALVMPSWHENFGNVVVEAMARGVPALVSDRVGVAEDVSEGRGAEIVPASPDAWAGAMTAWMRDRRATAARGVAARKLVMAKFDWRSTGRQVLEHLRGLLCSG